MTILCKIQKSTEQSLGVALEEEDLVARADAAVREAPNWLQRLRARANRWSAVRHARKRAPKMSDELGDRTSRRREELLKRSVHIL